MAPVSARLDRRVRAEFGGSAESVLALLSRVPEQVPGGGSQDAERMQAALVLGTSGDVRQVAQRVVTVMTDWRDLLVGCGLADAGWPGRLDADLGPARRRWFGSGHTGR